MTAATAVLAAGGIHVGGWEWTGSFTTLDLIAAGTNALNGALLARRPDHYKNFTVVGIILMGEEPLAAEPQGVYTHDDGRPQLGRKLKDKSQRELKMLGLTVEAEADS